MDNFATERRAIDNEIYRIKGDHFSDLQKKFHIIPPIPESPKQAIEWIQAKNYIIEDEEVFNDDDDDDNYSGSWCAGWRFGTTKPDHKGFTEAYDKVKDAHKRLEYLNKVQEPKEMLKEVESFRNKTFH